MIKSKIEAREKALELSVKSYSYPNGNVTDDAVIQTAERFYLYLVGECELPEQEPSTEDIVNKTIDKYLEAFNMPKKEPLNMDEAIGIIGKTIN